MPAAGPPDPESEAARREVRRVLDDEVNRLPDTYRVPFVLCYLEGRSYEEISTELNIPVNSIGPILSRARKRLRRGVINPPPSRPQTPWRSPPTGAE